MYICISIFINAIYTLHICIHLYRYILYIIYILYILYILYISYILYIYYMYYIYILELFLLKGQKHNRIAHRG